MTSNRRSESNRHRRPGIHWRLPVALMLLAGSTLADVVQAATLHVATGGVDLGNCTMPANPCASVAYAVTQAEAGDTIMIAAGTYTESAGVDVDKSLSLQGAGAEDTILRAHAEPGVATSRVITIDGPFNVQIADLGIENGVSAGEAAMGGGLYANGAAVSLTGVAFSGNQAGVGGGFAGTDSTVVLANTSFDGNSATSDGFGRGGGLLALNGSVELTGVTFTGNGADGDGGGMMSWNNAPVLLDVAFSENTAHRGGGLFNQGGTLTLTDVAFTGNQAILEGGGLRNALGAVELLNVGFTGNSALVGGGFFNEGDATLQAVAFTGNTGISGGGMYHAGGSAVVNDSTFAENVVSRLPLGGGGTGGGMYADADGALQLEGVDFVANQAYSGAGLYNAAGSPALVDVEFSGNQATLGGGMLSAGGAATIAATTFAGNHAVERGGGMMNTGGATTRLDDVDFIENTAGNGGGMANSDSAPVLDDVRFTGNEASEDGGGMYNGNSTPELTRVTFTQNRTTGGSGSTGGGMQNSGSSPVLVEVAFIGNEAASSGGGMHNFNVSAPQLTDVVFRDNVAAGNSGGAMANSFECSPVLRNVIIADNTAQLVGGGIWSVGGLVTLIDVVIVGNQSGSDGGGMLVREGAAALTNVTLAGNASDLHGGGLVNDSESATTMRNTIIWGNTAAGIGDQIMISPGASVSLVHSLYGNAQGDIDNMGSFTTENSLTLDPIFVDAANGNLRLAEGSPAVNAGDPATDFGVFATDGNGDPIDIDGNPRLVGVAIDLGAYESGFETLPQPVLAFDPASLDFGDVGVDIASPPRTAVLRNLGNAVATGLSFELAGDVFAADTGDCGGALGIGADCELVLTFTPDATGPAAGELVASADGGASGALGLSGNGVELPPRIELDPASIDVAVPEGETFEQALTIGNGGHDPLDWTIATAPVDGLLGGSIADCEAEPGLIRHDDGTIESGFPSIVGFMFVDHFVPDSYPAVLNAACLAFLTAGPTALDFELIVFADDGPGGSPGTQLGALALSATDIPGFPPQPPALPTWQAYDLSPLGLSIESGGVYIGVRWTQMADSVLLAIDASPPNPPGFAGGYVWNGGAQMWMPMTDIIPDYRALFIRAVATAGGGCGETVHVGWLDIAPAEGSTAGLSSSEVTLRFDAHGLAPGVYETLLCIDSNDPARPVTTVPVAMTVGAPVPRSVNVISGSDQTAVVGTPFALPLAVQVRDGSSRPLADVEVQFAAPADGAAAVLSASTAMTDANGYAAVTAIANGNTGTYTVSASVVGIAQAAEFPLANVTAVTDVAVAIFSEDEYVQRGRIVDYLVRIDNHGETAANGVDVASALAAQLDLPFAGWTCLGPASSGCTASGQGELVDEGLIVAAGGSVVYALSAPVRSDADGTLHTSVDVGYADDPEPGNDNAFATSVVVVYRDGFQMYGDGSQALPLMAHDELFDAGKRLVLRVPDASGGIVDALLDARSAEGDESAFRVERLNAGTGHFVRIVLAVEGIERASGWAPVPVGSELTVTMEVEPSGGDAGGSVSMAAGGAALRLSLPSSPSRAYRLAAAVPIDIEETAAME